MEDLFLNNLKQKFIEKELADSAYERSLLLYVSIKEDQYFNKYKDSALREEGKEFVLVDVKITDAYADNDLIVNACLVFLKKESVSDNLKFLLDDRRHQDIQANFGSLTFSDRYYSLSLSELSELAELDIV